jgi:hypothetical protein
MLSLRPKPSRQFASEKALHIAVVLSANGQIKFDVVLVDGKQEKDSAPAHSPAPENIVHRAATEPNRLRSRSAYQT